VRRPPRLVAVALVAGAVSLMLPAAGDVSAAESDEHVTTSSTRTVAWATQNPRHPDDGTATVRAALEDWKLRVSQTRDLLNQTVEVSWDGGGATGSGTFLQLMQCWSDGPEDSPTREQCAYGGADPDLSASTGAGRTRALGSDPREQQYRYDADYSLVAVNGGAATATWQGTDEVVFGTSGTACPAATSGYRVEVVGPKGSGIGTVVMAGPTSEPPGTVSVQSGSFTRTYDAASPPMRLVDVAAKAGRTSLPEGPYRIQLTCLAGTGQPAKALFVGWVEHTSTPGTWKRSFHEGGVSVPFDPLGSSTDTSPTDPYEGAEVFEYLKPRSTNEVWFAKSAPDGTGSVFFELQTDLEAQHLGCGRVDAGTPRACWLVAVPRWAGEPDGSEPSMSNLSTPLSQTHWDRRIEVPLAFAPVAAGCKIASGLKQVLAHDSALTALRSWQPEFCEGSNTASSVLGPLQDFSVRLGLSQPNRMGVVGVPDEHPATAVKAPLLTSGVVIGFAIDRRIPYGQEGYALDGTRETTLNLNARLVAKLLTQSYDSGAAPNGGKSSGYNSDVYSGGFHPTFTPKRSFPADNPRRLYDDPEFQELNPAVMSWLRMGANLPPQDMADVLVSFGDTDAYQVLWQWVTSDPEAKAFLAGTPDPDGMRVNPYYRGQLTSATSSFPLLDPTCVDNLEAKDADGFPLLCQINNHPRVEDDGDAAQAAVRGDTKRVNQAPLVFSGATGYRAEPRQEVGQRGLLVVTTTAVAERYGLPTARLQNASDTFAAATPAAMAAARRQMTERSDGVLLPRPEKVSGDGYPLTTMSYAIVDVAATTQAQNDAFAAILSYAVEEGQTPGTAVGQLPPGYAPLSPALAAQTLTAIATLRDPSGLLAEAPAPAAPADPGSAPSAPAPVTGGSALPPVTPGEVTVPRPVASDSPLPPQVAVQASLTGALSSPLRLAVPVLVLVALLAGASGVVLRTFGRKAS